MKLTVFFVALALACAVNAYPQEQLIEIEDSSSFPVRGLDMPQEEYSSFYDSVNPTMQAQSLSNYGNMKMNMPSYQNSEYYSPSEHGQYSNQLKRKFSSKYHMSSNQRNDLDDSNRFMMPNSNQHKSFDSYYPSNTVGGSKRMEMSLASHLGMHAHKQSSLSNYGNSKYNSPYLQNSEYASNPLKYGKHEPSYQMPSNFPEDYEDDAMQNLNDPNVFDYMMTQNPTRKNHPTSRIFMDTKRFPAQKMSIYKNQINDCLPGDPMCFNKNSECGSIVDK